MTAAEIIETKIKPIAENGFSDALEIMQLIALLKAQNSNNVNKALSKAGAGRAAIAARNAFIARLTLLVVRCYAKPRAGDLHIRQAFNLISKDQRVRDELARRNSGATVKDAEDRWLLCRGDHRLKSLEHFRDKYTAHLGEPEEDIPLPKYDELFPFAEETAKLMQALANAAGVNTHKLSDWSDEIVGSAEALWEPWKSEDEQSKNPNAKRWQ